MVMSMDMAADQVMGSPMEDSALSIRHQESVDEELNMDEQSKASNQTVVDVAKNQQQQQQQQQKISNPQAQYSYQSKQQDENQQQYETKKNETEMSAAMVLSRESSFNEDEDDDRRKLMMHVDYMPTSSASIEQKQGAIKNEQIVMKHKYEVDRDDVDRKDPLVARMREIVEGNQQSTVTQQCQHHHQHHHHHQQPQPKSSSGDSLNNQPTENNSKASMDSAQQKRSRQTRHCGHHHHHHRHHHHRPSLGANIGTGQTASTGHHHHHHHHHHKNNGHQHAHRHHHHHQQLDSGGNLKSTGDVIGGRRTSIQRPVGESSFSQTETSRQTGESKSSNSSVSSAPVDQQQQQQQQQLEQQPQQEAIKPNKSNPELLNQSAEAINENPDSRDGGLERCMHHPSCHHHHNPHVSGSAQHPPHHHHHHHHYHGRHHHHRNHKKRLVQDTGDDQVDNQLTQQERGDNGEQSGFEIADRQHGIVADMSHKDPADRPPLQEIGSQSVNLTQATGQSYCPHHEHHYAALQSRGNLVKLQPHHHHHHHHQHADLQSKKDVSSNDQQYRGHHHHHHHRHHHHGQHHNKTRARRHKSSSNTNIDEQTQRDHSADFEPSVLNTNNNSNRDKQQQHQTEDIVTKEEIKASVEASERHDPNSTSKQENLDSENKMHLDQSDGNQRSEQQSSEDKACSEVVNMEISPNNENKHNKRAGLVNKTRESVDLSNVDSNFIASIDISGAKSCTNEQFTSGPNEKHDQQQQQQQDSDFNAQNASVSDATKNNSVHEFTRSQEGDSMKQSCGKDDRLVGQVSRENSRKEMVSGAGAGASKQQEQQQPIECSPIQQDTYQQTSQPKQVVESTVSPDRRCVLCWCCCCPCSGLSTRSNPTKAETKQSVVEAPSSTANKCQAIPNSIPLDKIRSWSESFDRLMKCPDGRRIFQDFLRCEYSEENILFWIACEELKHEKDAKSIATKARDIYEDYISILSAKEVSLDSRVRDIINNNIKKPTSNIFDEAQLQIYTLMHRDSYPRFINSPMYKKLAQIQTSSSRKGSS